MSTPSLVERYLELKISTIIKDTNKKEKILKNIVNVLKNISINEKSLIDYINNPQDDEFSFRIIEPFIYAVIYQEDRNLYRAIVINKENKDSVLFTFELMTWMRKITDKIINTIPEKDLPGEIKQVLKKEFGEDVKHKQPKYLPKFETQWMDIRKRYSNNLEDSIFNDLVAYLKITDVNAAKKIAHEINEIISRNVEVDFPPPPYSIIISNYQVGFPIQFDKHIYFVEYINTSNQLGWKEPELAELWIDLLRQAILKNEIAFSGIKEIISKFSTSQGNFKNLFVNKINEWAKERENDYQYPVFMLILAMAQLIRERKLAIPAMDDFKFLPGTPAYNVKKISTTTDEHFIKKAVAYMKGYLYNANRQYFNYFIYENSETISNLANMFCCYAIRKSDKETWEELIRLWLSQFDKEYMMDLALDILDNILFIKTDDVVQAFKSWIERDNTLSKINNGEVLMIYEPDSSVVSVLDQLRKKLPEIKISDHKWKISSNLELDDNCKPLDSKVILYLKKDKQIKYFKNDNREWTNIIYIEDNVGTGNQAVTKINSLKKYLKHVNLEKINIHYWSYYVVDIEDVKQKLREKGLPEEIIVYHINLRDYERDNKIIRIYDLLNKKYTSEKDVLVEKLRRISLKVSLSGEKPLKWVEKDNQWLGWGGLGLLVVFEHGTPNNTLPILWRDSNDYFSLFPRSKPQENNQKWKGVEEIIERFGEIL